MADQLGAEFKQPAVLMARHPGSFPGPFLFAITGLSGNVIVAPRRKQPNRRLVRIESTLITATTSSGVDGEPCP